MMIRGPRLLGPDGFAFAPHLNIGDIYTTFRGESQQLEADARRAGDKAGQTIGERIKSKLTAANIGTGIGVALGGAGVAALKVADQYKAAVDTIRVGTGATGDALAGLEGSFQRVAGRVREDIGSTAQVMANLNTGLGLTGDDLEELTEKAIKFGRITGFDVARGTSDIIRLFGDWSVATEDQAEALDKVFRASQATGIEVDELMRLMVQFGAPLRQLGFDFESAAALMGKWEREGVNTQLVIGGMRIALGKLAKEGVPAGEMAAEFRDRLEGIRTSANPATDAIALFGQRAGADLAAAIQEGRFEIDDYVDAIANGEDTVEQAIEDSRTFADTFGELKNAVAVAVGPIVKDLAGIGETLGSAVFLLPALTGALGRGIGIAFAKVAPIAIGSAGTVGQLAGRAFGAGFAAAAAIGIAVVVANMEQQLGRAARSTLDDLFGTDFSGDDRAHDRRAQMESFAMALQTDLESVHEAVLDEIERNGIELDRAERKTGGLAPEAFAQAYQAAWDRVRSRGALEPVEALAVAEDFGLEVGDALGEGVTAGVAAGAGSIGETVAALVDHASGIVIRAVDDAIARARKLADAIGVVSSLGLKDLKQNEKEADKAWRNIIGAGDRNKRRLRQVNELLEKWQRRLSRANSENDSEAAAFAQAQIDRLTAEQAERREVVRWTNRQRRALERLPEETKTKVILEVVGGLRGLTEMRDDRPRRHSGGRVQRGRAYLVGTPGHEELFMADRSGEIVSNDDIQAGLGGAGGGGGETHFHAEVHGLPMQASTPKEVVQQQRRAARFGVAMPRRPQAFRPALG